MGRPPSNGGPSFRFNPVEVGEMEAVLQAHNYAVPSREILEALAQRFSGTAERAGKVEVSAKQVWNWFQNRRYALRARAAKAPVPGQVNVSPMPQNDQATVGNVPPAPPPQPAPPSIAVKNVPQVPHPLPASSVQSAGTNASDCFQMEFEAKSARDGAWYDVTLLLSHRSLETGDPEALVRFAGFGPEEDEWVNIRRHVRQRSLPCEASECVAVLPGDLVLCFQEGKEQALYFDAHVLDAQRRRHDVRGCRCRFLVRYDHDQAEEIVPLRKICRRPETDYRLQQLHAESINVNPQKAGVDPQVGNTFKVDATQETTPQKQPKPEERVDSVSMTIVAPPGNVPVAGESKLPPSSVTIVAPPTNVPVAGESKLPPSSVTIVAPPANVPVAGESKLPPSSMTIGAPPANVPVAGESKIPPSAMTIGAPPANVAVAGESKLPPSAMTVGAPPANIPVAGESKLPPSAMTVGAPPANIPVAGESKLPPSAITVGAPPTNVPVAGESKLPPSAMTTGAPPANVAVAGESKLPPSAMTIGAPPANVSESELPPSAMTVGAPPANVAVAGESKLPPSAMTTGAPPANVPVAGESELPPSAMTTDAPPANVPVAGESKLPT